MFLLYVRIRLSLCRIGRAAERFRRPKGKTEKRPPASEASRKFCDNALLDLLKIIHLFKYFTILRHNFVYFN